MEHKPFLFHDIDGVLYGEYEGCFQLRPGIKGWLAEMEASFELVWLTTWPAEKIQTLLRVIKAEKYWVELPEAIVARAAWEQREAKELWLSSQREGLLRDRAWLWLDDNIPTLAHQRALGIDGHCLQVSPTGAQGLAQVRPEVALWLAQGGEFGTKI